MLWTKKIICSLAFLPNHRERKTKFENSLANDRRKMETFRLRETKEFLSIDELKEKCDISAAFMETLKVRPVHMHINLLSICGNN